MASVNRPAGTVTPMPPDPRVRWIAVAVANRAPLDDREEASLRRFRTELSRLARPFDESAGPVHVTASAVLVGRRGVLLHRHKRLGLWLQPGGHIEPGEWPDAAARREAAEETGVTLTPPGDRRPRVAHVDVHGGGRGHVHLDVRYLLEADGDPAPGAGESTEVRWFDWDTAVSMADAGLVGLLRAVRDGRGFAGRA